MRPGTTVGPYSVESELGSGGMGVVYRARDTRLSRTVAIKVLPDTTDPERLARFEREARILASLQHPNIAGIHALEAAEGERFLVLEFVAGETLAARLARGPLPVAEALDACRQVAAALEAAHEAGVVHRDLKPGNVMLTPEGQVKVLDFGLARVEGHADEEAAAPGLTVAATLAGVVLGTAAYMSPEQARGRPTDRRTDIWSFGCVLYECLTGRQAFAGETVSDSIARILEREPDLDALPPALPEPIVQLVARCLEKDPRQRLRDVGEARWALEHALARRTPSGRIAAAAPAGARRRGGRPALDAPWIAGAALALAAAAGGAAWLARAPAEPLRCVAIPFPPEYSVRGSTMLPDGSALTAGVVPHVPDAQGQAQPRLVVRPLDSYEFRLVPQTVGFVNSWMSPDGKRLLLLVPAGAGMAQRRLATMPLDGSAPLAPLADWRDEWQGACWLASGDVLVTDGATSYLRIPANGGPPSASRPIVVEADERVSAIEFPPATLPGDDRVFVNVVSYDARGWHYAVGLLTLATGHVRLVSDDGGNAVYWRRGGLVFFARGHTVFAARFDARAGEMRGTPVPVWSGLRTTSESRPGFFRVLDDGALYYAPGGTGEGRALAVVDSAGNVAPLATERRTFDETAALAPDGTRFVCSVANGRGIDELWLGAIDRTDLRRLGTDPDADCTTPCWSPDGARIAYRRFGRDARDGIYVQDVAGGAARCVWRSGSADTTYRATAWTPDGAALLVWRAARGREDVCRLALAGDPSDRARLVPILGGARNARFARVSPDGARLAWLSDETGRFEAYVAPLREGGVPGAAMQVSSAGSFACLWSPDGRRAYVGDTRNHVFALAATGGALAAPAANARPALDLDRLDVAWWAPLARGRFLVALRSRDESTITSYQLVLGWGRAAEKKLRAGGSYFTR